MMTNFFYRSKLVPDPPKSYTYLAPGVDFRPETSPYFPKDFDIECPPHDGLAQAPQYVLCSFFAALKRQPTKQQ